MKIKEPEVKYVTEKGKPEAVILSIKDYERLLSALEDLSDIQSAEHRRTERSVEYLTYRKKRLSRTKTSR
ncbi:MAG: type II toxin-antitoxin system prevent-host-death family antitoxin [bacterium]